MDSALNIQQHVLSLLTRVSAYHLIFILILAPWFQLGQACGSRAEKGVSTETLMLCRSCGHEVANGSEVHFVPSRLALSSRNDTLRGGRRITVQLFENPHERRFEVLTFRRAAVALHWPADKRFSWFPGFAWTIATCPRCRAHLVEVSDVLPSLLGLLQQTAEKTLVSLLSAEMTTNFIEDQQLLYD